MICQYAASNTRAQTQLETQNGPIICSLWLSAWTLKQTDPYLGKLRLVLWNHKFKRTLQPLIINYAVSTERYTNAVRKVSSHFEYL